MMKMFKVLHGFETAEQAHGHLSSKMFNDDVVVALNPYWRRHPTYASIKRLNDPEVLNIENFTFINFFWRKLYAPRLESI